MFRRARRALLWTAYVLVLVLFAAVVFYIAVSSGVL
jgi:hypothetical protein